jgi:drug/metabolite transporter (DMT)-like permease
MAVMKSFFQLDELAARLPANLRGAAWMICAGACWVAMTTLVRDLSADYTAFELLFMRNLVAVSLLLPPALRFGVATLKTKRLGLHFLRTVFSYLAVLALFFGIAILPLPEVTALSFTQPLFVIVLATLILKEVAGTARWWAVIVGFLGVLVIVRPGFAEIGVATFLVLLSSLSYACSNICVKRLLTTDTPNQSVVYFNLLMLPLSLIPALFTWVTPGPPDLFRMVGIGFCGTLAVYAYARAFALAQASAVMPYDFLRLPMATLAAFVLFGETGDPWVWAGSLIIFGSSYLLARTDTRSNGEKPPS